MKRRRVVAAVIATAVVVAPFVFRHREAARERWEAVPVRQGEVRAVLRESGELAPHDPILVKAPFNGRISFIVEDGAWVEKGEPLVILGDDDEVKRLSDDRAQLVGVQQELRLSRLKRAQAAESEAIKLASAKRALALEEARWRILSTDPVGGMELAKLSDQLEPLEAETAKAREAAEDAGQEYQQALDAYLEALDAQQDHRDAFLRAQAKVDELAALAEADPQGMQAVERAERDKAATELPPAREELEKLRGGGEELARKLAAARTGRDARQGPRDQAAATLSERETAERELRIRVEIEKRGLPLAQARLDERGAELQLAEAERKRDEGRGAFASGALSRAALDDLETAASSAANQLEIVRNRVAIAARPTPPETLEEAKAKLERARERAERAQASHDRALAIKDKEIEVLEARVAKYDHSISARCARFPALLEDSLRFAERELAELGQEPEDAARRKEIEASVETMRAQLAKAKADPPNVLKAPASGICRLRREGDRAKQAGDRLYEEDPAIELYPPEHMEVLARVNEANVARLATGMPATIEIPALPGEPRHGVVSQVAGAGKDKSTAQPGRPFADVTQFEVRVALDATSPDFRQGMTALVTVELARKTGVVWLPLAAVARDGDGWRVFAGGPSAPRRHPVTGEPFGADAFIVTGGLAAGDTVYIERVSDE
jgi:multidrug resistance efflux pump